MSTVYLPEIKRDLSVNFSIKEVKNSINVICQNINLLYQIKDKNDIMNTYTVRFTLPFPFFYTHVSIQLKKISDTETSIFLTTYGVKNEYIDNFLGLISKSLSGEVITEESLSNGKSGCLGTIIGMIVITGTLSYILLS